MFIERVSQEFKVLDQTRNLETKNYGRGFGMACQVCHTKTVGWKGP